MTPREFTQRLYAASGDLPSQSEFVELSLLAKLHSGRELLADLASCAVHCTREQMPLSAYIARAKAAFPVYADIQRDQLWDNIMESVHESQTDTKQQ